MTEENPQLSTNEQIIQRRDKLKNLRLKGNAYPNDFRRENLAQEIFKSHAEESAESLSTKNILVKVAGRIMTRRVMGKASFTHIQDMSGKIQIYVRQNDLPDGLYEQFLHWDLGDIIGVSGTVFKTKTGELSIKAKELFLLTKALLPMPEKFHGLVDHETRYRQRYLDLMVNSETRRVFQIRSHLIAAMRNFLVAKGFLEVETPMMHVIPGGAIARPFITHHNALDMQLYLRIAPELYLKRLVVGGMEKVFEINRSFRNEGISPRHNPEFTMMEFYEAYRDYRYLMDFTEELLRTVAKNVLGVLQVRYGEHVVDLSQPFARLSIAEAICKFHPEIPAAELATREGVIGVIERRGIDWAQHVTAGGGAVQLHLFEETTEALLIQPTFIVDYPAEVSPLARRNDANPET